MGELVCRRLQTKINEIVLKHSYIFKVPLLRRKKV